MRQNFSPPRTRQQIVNGEIARWLASELWNEVNADGLVQIQLVVFQGEPRITAIIQADKFVEEQI